MGDQAIIEVSKLGTASIAVIAVVLMAYAVYKIMGGYSNFVNTITSALTTLTNSVTIVTQGVHGLKDGFNEQFTEFDKRIKSLESANEATTSKIGEFAASNAAMITGVKTDIGSLPKVISEYSLAQGSGKAIIEYLAQMREDFDAKLANAASAAEVRDLAQAVSLVTEQTKEMAERALRAINTKPLTEPPKENGTPSTDHIAQLTSAGVAGELNKKPEGNDPL